MKQFILFFALFSLLSACQKSSPFDMPLPINNHIRFDALEVGQTAQYIGLNGSAYFFENMSFKHSDDTLRLEIVDKDAKGYKVAESLHYVSYVHP